MIYRSTLWPKKPFIKLYCSPKKLHRIFPATPPLCWRCDAEDGTVIHIWWTCPRIAPLWQQVFALYAALYSVIIPSDSKIPILSILPGTISAMKKSMLRYFLTAIKQIIPGHWKSTDITSMAEWLVTMELMEQAIGASHWSKLMDYGARANDCLDSYYET